MRIKRQGRLGWSGLGAQALYLAVALFFFSSGKAWSLDLDAEIARRNKEVAQISSTLGTTRTSASASTEKMVTLQLIKKPSRTKHFAHKKAHKTSKHVAKHMKAGKAKKIAQKSSKRRGRRA